MAVPPVTPVTVMVVPVDPLTVATAVLLLLHVPPAVASDNEVVPARAHIVPLPDIAAAVVPSVMLNVCQQPPKE